MIEMPLSTATLTNPFRFGTKAGTLESLRSRIHNALIPEQLVLTASAWETNRASVMDSVLEKFANQPLAVRSSAINEDTLETSNAGAFLSLTGVVAKPDTLGEAIDQVFASYDSFAGYDFGAHEVLIQPMILRVVFSGVVLTRDLDTGSPYYIINYDDFTGRTDTVTSGGESKTVMIHRGNAEAIHSQRITKIFDMVRELEAVTGSDTLDIEFCLDVDLAIYLLQVRPLAARSKWHRVEDNAIAAALEESHGTLVQLMQRRSGIAGETTILGDMPDWNPAEMIGNTPRPLAVSLYRQLITDQVWSDARASMGYQDVGVPLMTTLSGRPYIDVRLSLNSFLPADLNADLSERLVNWQLAHLAAHPDLHDKIEFSVTPTCHDLSFGRWREQLTATAFSQSEIDIFENSMIALTSRAIQIKASGIDAILQKTRGVFDAPAQTHSVSSLDTLPSLLKLIVSNGTLPFSVLARHGFIGVILLRSLKHCGILDDRDIEVFMSSVHTVAVDLVRDISALATEVLQEDDFLKRYGHLRPGTYDILSWRYDEKPHLYLGHSVRDLPPTPEFRLDDQKMAAVEARLAQCGYLIKADELFRYIAAAIAAREEAKFSFSKGVSNLLNILAAWGQSVGLSREELSFLEIDEILAHQHDVSSLRERSACSEARHHLTRAIKLSSLIVEEDDIYVVRPLRGQPNFITNKSVTASSVVLLTNEISDLDGRIVLIESADPGYDWVFSHNIAGLITKHGGANSLMAIRCAEFALPAVIGCGEKLFETLAGANVIELNAGQRKVSGH